jgi:hypothetical protein
MIHCPSEHNDPVAWGRNVLHSVPQVPQLFISVSRLTQLSPHKLVRLSVQAGPHRAFTQISWLPQARPQTPQLFLSEKTFTQELPQGIWPEEQDNSGVIIRGALVLTTGAEVPGRKQRLFWQFCPDGQPFPHDPQFAASFTRSLHVPLQELRPDGHDPWETAEGADVAADTAGFCPAGELNCPFRQVSP